MSSDAKCYLNTESIFCSRNSVKFYVNTEITKAEIGPGKQVTSTGVGPGNIPRWKLNFPQKIEFEERGYFGITKLKKNYPKITT